MTKKEIIKQYEMAVEGGELIAPFMGEDEKELYEMLKAGLSAIRPVSRERIEKVWKGEWIKERRQTYIPVGYDEQGEVILHDFVVYRCSICGRENTKEEPFCNCGAPMTDAAVLTVMDRLEVLKDGRRDHAKKNGGITQ